MLNWNIFKVKFDGKETITFEGLAYQLFCSEFNIKIGIPKFKNQVGIETEPIEVNGDVIGFQAKYYETKISNNKEDIIDSIKKAKKKNPNLTKIFIYLNQEISESSKEQEKDPKYKKDIEGEAKKLGVQIEWRVPSHIERQLALPENRNLRDLFFSLDKNVFDLINKLQQHTEAILTPIHSEIKFGEKTIKLDREEIIDNLINPPDNGQIVILTGEAGVGKTAIVKDFYTKFKDIYPIYLFKATEFDLNNNINELFKQFGDFTLTDFIDVHNEEKQKYIFIDSAEKLSDLDNQDPFLEFLSTIIKNRWKVILTTRQSYLDSLQFQFIEIYHTPFRSINIESISEKQFIQLSEEFGFEPPLEKRLLELIKIPFYLAEYLESYKNFNKNIIYSDFKKSLWEKKIQNSSQRENNIHLRRENCFLNLAKQRADSGRFYIPMSDVNCENEVLQKLLSDEIIQYDKNYGGYFITHDVYEEWALEKIIEIEFNKSCNNKEFFNNIGSSYPIRRAFRNWLSEKLFQNGQRIKTFIEEVIIDDSLERYWKDETLISVLLSDYSKTFFEIFEKKLLTDNFELFKRIIFLIRTACKDVDEDILRSLDVNNRDAWEIEYVFTKPKGNGWETLIEFIYNHLSEVGLANIDIVLPLLYDWNNKNKKGETTKRASLIALHYYKKLREENIPWKHDKNNNKLIQIILYGASEIKEELESVFNEVLKNKWNNYGDPYYDIVKTILTTLDGIQIVLVLPEYVLKLADLFWFRYPDRGYSHLDYDGDNIERYYCLNHSVDMSYFPASAYQTPIYCLLKTLPKETVDFILNFTNKCVECYANSGFDKSIKEVTLIIDDKATIKQYVSESLWNMYRGTGSPVTPYLLQSIHMALEKFFLEQIEHMDSKTLEDWLLYLIKNSKSASITAVVTSIVLACPDKTFDIAKILFQTKEFFFYDKHRQLSDKLEVRNLYSISYGPNYQDQICRNERLKTCEDKHREWDLEKLIRYYQFFRSENVNDEEAKKRQEIIWRILDDYYSKLPDRSKETDEDKTWELFLARMDRRKMKPTFEIRDNQILMEFHPQIEPDLKKYSEEPINKSNELMKYIPLKSWATYKFKKDEGYKDYKQYEGNIQLILKEVREIVSNLNNGNDYQFLLFNYEIPAYTCAVLIRDYLNQLSEGDKEFCKSIIFEYASLPLRDNYQYQTHDGVEPAIDTLPLLLKIFPSERERIKIILLLTLFLFDSSPIVDYSIKAILNNLWDISFKDAQSLFVGYLLLKPKYNKLLEKFRQENYKNGIFKTAKQKTTEKFLMENESDLEKVINNEIEFNHVKGIEKLDIESLEVAFELIPINTKDEVHKSFIKIVLPIFAEKILKDRNKIDHTLKDKIFTRFAYFILNREKDEIKEYIQPFIDNFANSREMADFFQAIISVEDKLNKYEQFWLIWEGFYNKIVELCNDNYSKYYKDQIIYNYLLAYPYWKESAKNWHTLKEREKLFFKKVAEDMGHCPAVLYSISKLLNGIGSDFVDDGIVWISDMINKNENLWTAELEKTTIYYLETIVKKCYILNRETIRKDLKLKSKIVIILNFLIERGSTVGFLLREEIF